MHLHHLDLIAAAAAAAVLAWPAAPARADEPAPCTPGPVLRLDGLATPDDELARLAVLAGAAPPEPGLVRRAGPREAALCEAAGPLGWSARAARPAAEGDGLRLLPARLGTIWNSTYPSGGNDGLLWAGRGAGATATLGVEARWGPVTAVLAPEVAWQQNRWFELAPTGLGGDRAFGSAFYGDTIDLPQRFGAGPYATASLGQSSLRVDAFGATAGLSTESRWFGPGQRSSLILSNTAPGFAHAFLGTAAPVATPIGAVEALAFWGRLDRSRHAAERGHPWITGLALDWQPRWVPGLSLGAGRVFVETLGSLQADAWLTVLEGVLKSQVRGGNNPEDNQVAALWFRWTMPEVGFEVYGEWGRDDFPSSMAGLVREPDRTAGYVAGLQKVFRLGGARALRVQAEVARLYEARPLDAFGGLPAWYTHPDDLGYTHQGQLLGAAIGPGGAAQSLAVDWFGEGGLVGAWIERVAHNEEAFWTWAWTRDPIGAEHDAEVTAGVRQVLFAGPVEVSWRLAGAYRWSRDFLRNEPNLQASVQVAIPLDRAPAVGSTPPPRQGTNGAPVVR